MDDIILDVQDLKKYFPIRGGVFQHTVGYVKAVDGISFQLKRGETLGIVGESGCGKSTAGRTILRLHEITGGKVLFNGKDIAKLSKKELRKKRLEMQMVFQDPYSSLNPRMTVGQIIGEALTDHKLMNKTQAKEKVRAAPKTWYRPGTGVGSTVCHLRRTCIRSGCFHPVTDHQPSGRSAEGTEFFLYLHFSRSFCGGIYQ